MNTAGSMTSAAGTNSAYLSCAIRLPWRIDWCMIGSSGCRRMAVLVVRNEMKYLRCAISWLLFAVGHVISYPMSRWDWASFIYPAYNYLMLTSSRLDTGDCGCWQDESIGAGNDRE